MQTSGPRTRASVDSHPPGMQDLLRHRKAIVKMIVEEVQQLNDGLKNERDPILMAKGLLKLTAMGRGAS